jgi:hypothetical protein
MAGLALMIGFAPEAPGAQQRRTQVSQLEDCLAECQASLGQEGAEILGNCKGGCWHTEAVRRRIADKCDVILQEANFGGMGGYKNCVTDVAVVVRDYTICRRIPDPVWRGECLSRLALETGNTAACREIPEECPYPGCDIQAVRNDCRREAERAPRQ